MMKLEVLKTAAPGSRPHAAAVMLRSLGSLWFAAVLLMCLLVAMACATVFESMHGTERALFTFYGSWWFSAGLALIAVNVSAAVAVRFPFTRHHVGFVLTHVGLLVILAGAAVTLFWGLDGQVGIAEGQTVGQFRLRDRESLTVLNRAQGTRVSVDLVGSQTGGFTAVDLSGPAALTIDGVRVTADRFLPDSEHAERVVNDNPLPRPAIEVGVTSGEQAWVFAGQTASLGATRVAFRVAQDAEELAQVLSERGGDGKDDGTVRISLAGVVREHALPDCLNKEVPLGDTGYVFSVLRYLPHATVGADNRVTNASPQLVNPAIEVEITGPGGSDTRWSFAKFPDFQSTHGRAGLDDVKVTFVAPQGSSPAAPIDVTATPDGDFVVRLTRGAGVEATQRVALGAPVEVPWIDGTFRVARSFDRARVEEGVAPVLPVRKERNKAIRVALAAEHGEQTVWLQKNSASRVTVDGTPYELLYADKVADLGFDLTLNDFEVGYYPGGSRPRSFESSITLSDRVDGATVDRVISMNHPAEYGGYTLYQSSYQTSGGQSVSFLSVARDPGQPIVFAGYFATIAGMIVVLVTRMRQRAGSIAASHVQAQSADPSNSGRGGGVASRSSGLPSSTRADRASGREPVTTGRSA